jgi:hypothetical protein
VDRLAGRPLSSEERPFDERLPVLLPERSGEPCAFGGLHLTVAKTLS